MNFDVELNMEEKFCTKCSEFKLPIEFGKNSKRKDKIHLYCKNCMAITSKEKFNKNPEKYRQFTRNWCAKNKPKLRYKHVRNRYNLSRNKYDELIDLQNNKCGICNQIFIKTPNVDHSHKTSIVRGLLCSNCNTGVGWIERNNLRKILKWLKK